MRIKWPSVEYDTPLPEEKDAENLRNQLNEIEQDKRLAERRKRALNECDELRKKLRHLGVEPCA